MPTLFITHPASLNHLNGTGHPERPDRIRAIESVLEQEKFQPLIREQAPLADLETAALCHPMDYIVEIKNAVPKDGTDFEYQTTLGSGVNFKLDNDGPFESPAVRAQFPAQRVFRLSSRVRPASVLVRRSGCPPGISAADRLSLRCQGSQRLHHYE